MTSTTTPKSSPPTLSSPRRWAAVAVLTASLLVVTMDMTILNIALPAMAADIHPTAEQQLWIVDVYSLILAGLLVPFAAVADRWGRKRMLTLGYTIFALASLLVLVADSPAMVIALRTLLGVGGAMIMPNTLSLIRIIFTDPAERAKALGIWAAVAGLGAAVGPLVGGFLLEHFTWHSAFLINVPLMAAAIIAGLILLPESRVNNPGPWDPVAAALFLAGMTLLVWSIKTFGKHAGFDVLEAWGALIAGTALLAWFAARCLRSPHPMLDLRLFRNRIFSAGVLAALGSTFAFVAALLLLAQWLQAVDGATPVEAGMRLIPAAAGAALVSLVAPAIAARIGARAVLAGGIGIAGLGMLVIGLQPGELHLFTVLIALAMVGAGNGSLAIGSAMIMAGSPVEKAGNAGAIEESSYELGAVLGVAILGSIAALLYRAEFANTAAYSSLNPAAAEDAAQSIGAASAYADQAALPQLAHDAGIAFTHAMQITGIAGGVLMLAVALAVYLLTPRGTDIAGVEH